jgi:hypothetical protein
MEIQKRFLDNLAGGGGAFSKGKLLGKKIFRDQGICLGDVKR